MRNRSAWHILVFFTGLTGLVAAVVAWRPVPVGAMDPPPPWLVCLPYVRNVRSTFLLTMLASSSQGLSTSFFAVNGGPIDGGAGTGVEPDPLFHPAFAGERSQTLP